MKKSTSLVRLTQIVLGSALALMLLSAAQATNTPTLQPVTEQKAKALPLTTAFEKGEPGENGGPYTLVLKNTSGVALKLKATIIWSVASHNRANTINLPEHEIAAGGDWKISDLAAHDRVILSAEGFEKLEVTTPGSK
jgi:hypothetical protein